MSSSAPKDVANGPPKPHTAGAASNTSQAPQRPTEALANAHANAATVAIAEGAATKRKRRPRRKKNRRQSFAVPAQQDDHVDSTGSNQGVSNQPSSSAAMSPFYRLGQPGRRNLSSTSLDSQALLDHRGHPPMRTRRESRVTQNLYSTRASQSNHDLHPQTRPVTSTTYTSDPHQHRVQSSHTGATPGGESEADDSAVTDQTPLLSVLNHDRTASAQGSGYGMFNGHARRHNHGSQVRRSSTTTSASSGKRRGMPSRQQSANTPLQGHDINNPPSVPNSPKVGPDMGYDDVMVTDSFGTKSPSDRRATADPLSRDQLVDIDGDAAMLDDSALSTPRNNLYDHRRHTITGAAEGDVCYPFEGLSELGDEDYIGRGQSAGEPGPRRKRYKQWPDLSVLDEWSREEKESRSEGIRAKKISEPMLIGGRLRPQKNGWHRAEEDAPYRFTYFNEELPSTIHSQTISELLQPGQNFRELFIPDPPELSSDESSGDEDTTSPQGTSDRQPLSPNNRSAAGTRHPSVTTEPREVATSISDRSGQATPQRLAETEPKQKPKRFGSRPTFWLDVLSPTDIEMRVISKTFGIHPLTAEDIMMQEAREKVELFRNYYFVNYRTFEQDTSSENFLEPVNMYVVVFREGVISFHFSMTPHPANVRRRIRQLKDYLILSSDWISYAIIDDITDVFAPLIQSIEEEVDDIDDAILQLHSGNKDEVDAEKVKANDKRSDSGEPVAMKPGGDMLRRVGEGRKKVMGLYRLLGNKADVIKGFAKRCNEHWEIAPRSEIGLYLGDIQDHILTMTGNLSHYETLLSRAHSNYLAQINIRMNERQEQTADVLGKLTVLGTIVLPMNIITGMWGMNVLVPGQDVESLYWFWSITAGLVVFGVSCFFIAKRVYGIV
ncbi:MAG: hypothetical protein LQ342_001584 [Letrouitia transgressa]|nr:MAG: hypothetical protein LQ342_001584 [Letrouitia transgressa]